MSTRPCTLPEKVGQQQPHHTEIYQWSSKLETFQLEQGQQLVTGSTQSLGLVGQPTDCLQAEQLLPGSCMLA